MKNGGNHANATSFRDICSVNDLVDRFLLYRKLLKISSNKTFCWKCTSLTIYHALSLFFFTLTNSFVPLDAPHKKSYGENPDIRVSIRAGR